MNVSIYIRKSYVEICIHTQLPTFALHPHPDITKGVLKPNTKLLFCQTYVAVRKGVVREARQVASH